MRVICSWCNTDLGEKEPFEDPDISHGICQKCSDSFLADLHAIPPPPQESKGDAMNATLSAMQMAEAVFAQIPGGYEFYVTGALDGTILTIAYKPKDDEDANPRLVDVDLNDPDGIEKVAAAVRKSITET